MDVDGMVKLGVDSSVIQSMTLDFNGTWSAINEDKQNELLKGSFNYLRNACDYSDFHQNIYAMLLSIFQNLVMEPGNPAWEILHQFILDESLPVFGRNNAVWIILGIFGHILGRPSYHQLVSDCIFILLKNMTTGVSLEQVSLNLSYYEHLDGNSPVKQPGIGLYALLGLYMATLWPICCRQLERLIDEEDGLLKTFKILTGLFDFRHSEGFAAESTQECDDFVASVVERVVEIWD